jgi:hypothetical protein
MTVDDVDDEEDDDGERVGARAFNATDAGWHRAMSVCLLCHLIVLIMIIKTLIMILNRNFVFVVVLRIVTDDRRWGNVVARRCGATRWPARIVALSVFHSLARSLSVGCPTPVGETRPDRGRKAGDAHTHTHTHAC